MASKLVNPTWFTAEEAAEAMMVHKDTVRTLLRRGDLKGIKVGNRWRTTEQWVNEFLLGGAVA